ncbi:MAG: hypothetical protein NZ954_08675 [Thermofilaceae archaeon]|nr:hypothetical protein [Thermofilaceae archaeon]
MLSRRSKRKKAEKILSALNSYTLMKKVEVSWRDTLDVLQDLEKHNLDYVYALTLQTMKRYKVTGVHANNKDFNRVEWVSSSSGVGSLLIPFTTSSRSPRLELRSTPTNSPLIV